MKSGRFYPSLSPFHDLSVPLSNENEYSSSKSPVSTMSDVSSHGNNEMYSDVKAQAKKKRR